MVLTSPIAENCAYIKDTLTSNCISPNCSDVKKAGKSNIKFTYPSATPIYANILFAIACLLTIPRFFSPFQFIKNHFIVRLKQRSLFPENTENIRYIRLGK